MKKATEGPTTNSTKGPSFSEKKESSEKEKEEVAADDTGPPSGPTNDTDPPPPPANDVNDESIIKSFEKGGDPRGAPMFSGTGGPTAMISRAGDGPFISSEDNVISSSELVAPENKTVAIFKNTTTASSEEEVFSKNPIGEIGEEPFFTNPPSPRPPPPVKAAAEREGARVRGGGKKPTITSFREMVREQILKKSPREYIKSKYSSPRNNPKKSSTIYCDNTSSSIIISSQQYAKNITGVVGKNSDGGPPGNAGGPSGGGSRLEAEGRVPISLGKDSKGREPEEVLGKGEKDFSSVLSPDKKVGIANNNNCPQIISSAQELKTLSFAVQEKTDYLPDPEIAARACRESLLPLFAGLLGRNRRNHHNLDSKNANVDDNLLKKGADSKVGSGPEIIEKGPRRGITIGGSFPPDYPTKNNIVDKQRTPLSAEKISSSAKKSPTTYNNSPLPPSSPPKRPAHPSPVRILEDDNTNDTSSAAAENPGGPGPGPPNVSGRNNNGGLVGEVERIEALLCEVDACKRRVRDLKRRKEHAHVQLKRVQREYAHLGANELANRDNVFSSQNFSGSQFKLFPNSFINNNLLEGSFSSNNNIKKKDDLFLTTTTIRDKNNPHTTTTIRDNNGHTTHALWRFLARPEELRGADRDFRQLDLKNQQLQACSYLSQWIEYYLQISLSYIIHLIRLIHSTTHLCLKFYILTY